MTFMSNCEIRQPYIIPDEEAKLIPRQRQGHSPPQGQEGPQVVRRDDKKLQATLKKMNVQPIQAIEEVNMFKEDGNVIHFGAPRGTFPTPALPTHFLYVCLVYADFDR